ncbi:MAG: Nif3-like dinuclear metal center hexameric protein [Bifidobacteriaceae bacterium]|nr:Nif3-like dinuclear metal center hexameric protein [Bifidobacteriaceae bacterium]
MTDVRQVNDYLNELYPLAAAEEWDYPGLVLGDPKWLVKKILLAVDPTYEIVQDAVRTDIDFLFTHHPLFFRGVHQLSGLDFRGALVNELISQRIALYCGHTNADAAPNGSADYFAQKLDLLETVPLFENLGRVGMLPQSISLRELAENIQSFVPATVGGIRVAGSLDAQVSKVALLPGSGDGLFDAVRATQADVYITSDLRHHPVLDLRQQAEFEQRLFKTDLSRPFLIDVPHYAAEFVFLESLQSSLSEKFPDLSIVTSTINTDPFTARFASN